MRIRSVYISQDLIPDAVGLSSSGEVGDKHNELWRERNSKRWVDQSCCRNPPFAWQVEEWKLEKNCNGFYFYYYPRNVKSH